MLVALSDRVTGDTGVPEPRSDDEFAELYARYAPRLIALCKRRLVHEPEEAEAIAQEAFARAWTARARYSAERPFWPWVATIARRLCVDHVRDARRDSGIRRRTRAERPTANNLPDEVLVEREERQAAVVAFEKLSPREQRLISLRDLEGWSYQEIADFEGISVEAVRSALKRARVSLRNAYRRR